MKTIQTLFLLCIILCQTTFAQQTNFILPQYPSGAMYVNAITGLSSSGSIASTTYSFDQNTYPEFKHTAQNAWYENGKMLFYVISGYDQTSGTHTLVYNANGKMIADVMDLAVNEIGLFKVSCSFYHVLIGKTLYALILEPYNGNPYGDMVKAGELPYAYHTNTSGHGSNGTGLIQGGTSIAISKPVVDVNDALNNYYTVYYIADHSTGSMKSPSLDKCQVFYNNNIYTTMGGNNNSITVSISSATVLTALTSPFAYSNITELELSPDQQKVAYIELDHVGVLDLATNTSYVYDLANRFPNNGAWYDCQQYYRKQACGLEFSPNSHDLAISFFDVFSTTWPSGLNAMISWNWLSGNYSQVAGTEKCANSFIELGHDLQYLALENNGTTLVTIDPTTLGIQTRPIPGYSLNFKSFNGTVGSCVTAQGNLVTQSQFYTLADQIDGMDYTAFNTDNCCTLPAALQEQVNQYIVSGNETWENDDILYKDVIVHHGATLTIKNATINFKETAQIIVEAGGKLLVDHAKLTNECNALWPGIEVRSNITKAQMMNTQGFVQVFNQSIIEHAVQAITVMPRAIVYAQSGSKIRNCLQGIKFYSCTDIADNISYVQDVTFECDALIPTQTTGTLKFIEFNGINWAGVYGCTFKNTVPYTLLDANNRGIGVDIISSNIALHKTHNVFDGATNCFKQTGLYNTFIQLSYGVLAVGSKHIVIDYANFSNCQASVVIGATGESHITNSTFTLDQNYVYQPRPFQDFILLSSVNGFTVSQNSFGWQEPLTVANAINGVRITQDYNLFVALPGELRNNVFTYDNALAPTRTADITGIYMNTALIEIKVEWNTFNALTVDWFLSSICRVQAQTGGSECYDPFNSWSQAAHTKFHILNNGVSISYCIKKTNPVQFNPLLPSSSLCTKVSLSVAVGTLPANLITCPYPAFDAAWGVNTPGRIPKIDINIRIEPNPITMSHPSISYQIKHVDIINTLTIYTMDGKQILQKFNQPAFGSLNLMECNLSTGIYYLQAITNQGITAQKFMVN